MPDWGLTKEMRRSKPYRLPEWWLSPGKVITDPIHGDVFITRLEQAIVDTPPFERLRRVRQLGTTHLVYPGATHTRFSHSLGAVQVVQTLLDAVVDQRNRNHPVPDLFSEWEEEHRRSRTGTGERGADPVDDDEASGIEFAGPEDAPERPAPEQVRKIAEATVLARLGALLHDLGHVPYGHAVEDDLKLLIPHDENANRFERLWEEVLEAIGDRLTIRASREGWSRSVKKERLAALEPLRPGGGLYRDLRPLVLAKEENEDGWIDPVKKIEEYPFVADMVGNTICADLLDYLQRDHRFTGLPMTLGRRYMSSFYVTPGSIGGIYQKRMAVLIHRDGRPRQDVRTEILKHLRYRYELQERVLVHHLKLTADAMIGKMIELWDLATRREVARMSPKQCKALDPPVPDGFKCPPPADPVPESLLALIAEDYPELAEPDDLDDLDDDDVRRIASWQLEQLFLARGDDGLLEHLRDVDPGDDRELRATKELATSLLDRLTYQHVANADNAYAAADLHREFGGARVRRRLEAAAAAHAGLSRDGENRDWHVILWVPGPDMRLKLADVLVDAGHGVGKFREVTKRGEDIYEAHMALWTISVFVHPTVTEAQARAVLAKLSKLTGITWDTHRDQLGADPSRAPEWLAAGEVLKFPKLHANVKKLADLAAEPEWAARGETRDHQALVTGLKTLAREKKIIQ